eukprot:7682903-Pyramimonas_sp.AAC.1
MDDTSAQEPDAERDTPSPAAAGRLPGLEGAPREGARTAVCRRPAAVSVSAGSLQRGLRTELRLETLCKT